MPKGRLIGNTSWQIQSGENYGDDDSGLTFYEIPYAGSMDTAEAFRTKWRKGTPCPVTQFAALKLKSNALIRNVDGVRGESVLRFEGVTVNPDNEPENDTEEHYAEKQQVFIIADSEESKGSYSYLSQVSIYSYTRGAKRSSTSKSGDFDDSEIEASIVLMEDANGFAHTGESLRSLQQTSGGVYEFKTQSGFVSVRRESDGVWTHVEMHQRIIEQAPAS